MATPTKGAPERTTRNRRGSIWHVHTRAPKRCGGAGTNWRQGLKIAKQLTSPICEGFANAAITAGIRNWQQWRGHRRGEGRRREHRNRRGSIMSPRAPLKGMSFPHPGWGLTKRPKPLRAPPTGYAQGVSTHPHSTTRQKPPAVCVSDVVPLNAETTLGPRAIA